MRRHRPRRRASSPGGASGSGARAEPRSDAARPPAVPAAVAGTRRRARSGARVRDRWVAVVLALAAFVVYNANGREAYPTGDSRPTGLLPFSLLYEHDLDLDEYHPRDAPVSGPIRREGGHIVSNYSPLPAILSLPIYLPALPHRVSIDGYMIRWEPFFSKLAGSVWASLAVACFFLAASRVASQRAAALTAIVLAFASPLWVSGSQTLGQHGLTVLLGSLVLYALARLEEDGKTRWALAAGTACALAVGIRLSNVLVFAAILVYLALFHRRRVITFVLPALVFGAPLAIHLLGIVGGASGGLQAFSFVHRIALQFQGSLPAGLAGLLVSPGEGLFVWAPVLVLLLLPFGAALAAGRGGGGRGGAGGIANAVRPGGRRRTFGGRDVKARASLEADDGAPPLAGPGRRRLMLLCPVIFLVLLLLYAKYTLWWGGRTYGPRYVTDLLPYLLLPAAAGLDLWLRKRAFWGAFVILLLASAYVQALGAFRYPCAGDVPGRVRVDEDRIWLWSETDVAFCARSPRRPPEDFTNARQLLKMTWLTIVR